MRRRATDLEFFRLLSDCEFDRGVWRVSPERRQWRSIVPVPAIAVERIHFATECNEMIRH